MESELNTNYKETVMDDLSQKFNHINTLGKIGLTPSWKTEKKFTIKEDKLEDPAKIWIKSLRG